MNAFKCNSPYSNETTKVRPNQIWQGEDDAHSLIIIARSMVLPYLIGLYFSKYLNVECVNERSNVNIKTEN